MIKTKKTGYTLEVSADEFALIFSALREFYRTSNNLEVRDMIDELTAYEEFPYGAWPIK